MQHLPTHITGDLASGKISKVEAFNAYCTSLGIAHLANKLRGAMAEIDRLPDNTPVIEQPQEVIDIIRAQGVTPLAAWRIHRGMTQAAAAKALDIKQSSVAIFEKNGAKRAKALLSFASLYQCDVEQIKF